MDFDYYTELGVLPDAPIEVIRAAHKALTQKHHPDRNGGSPEATAKTARLNVALETLSDPEKRRVYDEANGYRACAAPPPVKRALQSVDVDGHRINLRHSSGTVVANDAWVQSEVSSRGGGGLTMAGYGWNRAPRITTTTTQHQRLVVRVGARDEVFNRKGDYLPLMPGQAVDVIYAGTADNRQGGAVALVNKNSRQWFWTDSKTGAGGLFCSVWERLLDGLTWLGVAAAIAAILWFFFVRESGWFVWGAFIIIGIPTIIGGCTPLLFRRPDRIGDALEIAIRAG